MSFQQGLSGLNGASKSLDVIGNNIANSSTVGFKQGQAQFADIYANSLNGVGGHLAAGIGVSVSQVAQQFSQGALESSSNPLDIGINGNGFFRTSVNGAIQYSRNGQFQLDKDGFIINAQLAQLTGYAADATGKIIGGALAPIQIDPSDMPPKPSTTITTQILLDSASQVPATAAFSPDDAASYNKQIPVNVYDSLGNAHVMSVFYVRTNIDANTWDVYVANDGSEISSLNVAAAGAADPAVTALAAAVPFDPVAYAAASDAATGALAAAAGASAETVAAMTQAATTAGAAVGATKASIDKAITGAVSVPATRAGALVFKTDGTLDTTAMAAMVPAQTPPLKLTLPIFPATGADPLLPLSFDLTGSTQVRGLTTEKKTVQDGYAGAQLTRFAADSDGIIVGQYSNGRTRALGQIVLTNFTNPNGLEPLGDNAWVETSISGTPLVGVPKSGSLGSLRASSVENSNVDLTAELVNMITAQRAYQANAQTIKTQDSVMQTLLNLR